MRRAFGICQALSAAAIVWSAIVLDNVLPYLNVRTNADMWSSFWFDIGRAAWAVLPASVLWGASFPLALASLPTTKRRISGSVGVLYASNTAGAIVGAITAPLILVPAIGSQRAQQVMIGAAAGAAVLTLLPRRRWFIVPVLAAACAWFVPAVPGLLIAYGRYAGNWASHAGDVVYVGEGLNSSVAVSRTSDGVFNYHNAGKVQASTEPQDMRLQRMLGHLTTLLVARPRSVLVIGCGAGVTAGAVTIDPAVERVTIAEIEPLVPKVVASYFRSVDHDVIRNPKVRVVIDDARHVVTAGTEKFDAITSDPLDPWVKGAAALYTKEFFQAARDHLNPGGVLTVFVQLYHASPDAVKSEIGTFFDVFPDGVIWANAVYGQAFDMVLYGQAGPSEIDVDGLDWRLKQPQYAEVSRSLGEVGIASAEDLLSTYSGRLRDLQPWLLDAAINRDRNLRLQYLAGLDVDAQQGIRLFGEMLQYRRFPEDLFVGSDARLWSLRNAIEQAKE